MKLSSTAAKASKAAKAAVEAVGKVVGIGKQVNQDGSFTEYSSKTGFSSDLAVIHKRVDSSPTNVHALTEKYPIASRIFIDPVIKVISSGISIPTNERMAQLLDEMGFNSIMIDAFLKTLKKAWTVIAVWDGVIVYGDPKDTQGHKLYSFEIPVSNKEVSRLIAQEKEITDQIYNFGITSNKTMFVVNHTDGKSGDLVSTMEDLEPYVKTLKERSTMNNIAIMAGGKLEVVNGDINAPKEALLVIQKAIATAVGIPYSVLFETENVGGIGGNGEAGESFLRYQMKLRTIQRQILEPVYNGVLADLGIPAGLWQWNDPFAVTEKQRNEALLGELQAVKVAAEAFNIASQSVGMGAEVSMDYRYHLEEMNEKIAKAFENNKNNH